MKHSNTSEINAENKTIFNIDVYITQSYVAILKSGLLWILKIHCDHGEYNKQLQASNEIPYTIPKLISTRERFITIQCIDLFYLACF